MYSIHEMWVEWILYTLQNGQRVGTPKKMRSSVFTYKLQVKWMANFEVHPMLQHCTIKTLSVSSLGAGFFIYIKKLILKSAASRSHCHRTSHITSNGISTDLLGTVTKVMPTRCRFVPAVGSMLLLLLLATTLHQFNVASGFVFASQPAMKVPFEKQLNASQAFVKT